MINDLDTQVIAAGIALVDKAIAAVEKRRYTDRPGAEWSLRDESRGLFQREVRCVGAYSVMLTYAEDGAAYLVLAFDRGTGREVARVTRKGLDAAFKAGKRMADGDVKASECKATEAAREAETAAAEARVMRAECVATAKAHGADDATAEAFAAFYADGCFSDGAFEYAYGQFVAEREGRAEPARVEVPAAPVAADVVACSVCSDASCVDCVQEARDAAEAEAFRIKATKAHDRIVKGMPRVKAAHERAEAAVKRAEVARERAEVAYRAEAERERSRVAYADALLSSLTPGTAEYRRALGEFVSARMECDRGPAAEASAECDEWADRAGAAAGDGTWERVSVKDGREVTADVPGTADALDRAKTAYRETGIEFAVFERSDARTGKIIPASLGSAEESYGLISLHSRDMAAAVREAEASAERAEACAREAEAWADAAEGADADQSDALAYLFAMGEPDARQVGLARAHHDVSDRVAETAMADALASQVRPVVVASVPVGADVAEYRAEREAERAQYAAESAERAGYVAAAEGVRASWDARWSVVEGAEIKAMSGELDAYPAVRLYRGDGAPVDIRWAGYGRQCWEHCADDCPSMDGEAEWCTCEPRPVISIDGPSEPYMWEDCAQCAGGRTLLNIPADVMDAAAVRSATGERDAVSAAEMWRAAEGLYAEAAEAEANAARCVEDAERWEGRDAGYAGQLAVNAERIKGWAVMTAGYADRARGIAQALESGPGEGGSPAVPVAPAPVAPAGGGVSLAEAAAIGREAAGMRDVREVRSKGGELLGYVGKSASGLFDVVTVAGVYEPRSYMNRGAATMNLRRRAVAEVPAAPVPVAPAAVADVDAGRMGVAEAEAEAWAQREAYAIVMAAMRADRDVISRLWSQDRMERAGVPHGNTYAHEVARSATQDAQAALSAAAVWEGQEGAAGAVAEHAERAALAREAVEAYAAHRYEEARAWRMRADMVAEVEAVAAPVSTVATFDPRDRASLAVLRPEVVPGRVVPLAQQIAEREAHAAALRAEADAVACMLRNLCPESSPVWHAYAVERLAELDDAADRCEMDAAVLAGHGEKQAAEIASARAAVARLEAEGPQTRGRRGWVSEDGRTVIAVAVPDEYPSPEAAERMGAYTDAVGRVIAAKDAGRAVKGSDYGKQARGWKGPGADVKRAVSQCGKPLVTPWKAPKLTQDGTRLPVDVLTGMDAGGDVAEMEAAPGVWLPMAADALADTACGNGWTVALERHQAGRVVVVRCAATLDREGKRTGELVAVWDAGLYAERRSVVVVRGEVRRGVASLEAMFKTVAQRAHAAPALTTSGVPVDPTAYAADVVSDPAAGSWGADGGANDDGDGPAQRPVTESSPRRQIVTGGPDAGAGDDAAHIAACRAAGLAPGDAYSPDGYAPIVPTVERAPLERGRCLSPAMVRQLDYAAAGRLVYDGSGTVRVVDDRPSDNGRRSLMGRPDPDRIAHLMSTGDLVVTREAGARWLRPAPLPTPEPEPAPVAQDGAALRDAFIAAHGDDAKMTAARWWCDTDCATCTDGRACEDCPTCTAFAAPYPARWARRPEEGGPDRMVHVCHGPGGMSEGQRLALGGDDSAAVDAVGIEINEGAAATARAAGYTIIRADVRDLDPRHPVLTSVKRLHFSTPCPTISTGGKRSGLNPAEVERFMDLLFNTSSLLGHLEMEDACGTYGGPHDAGFDAYGNAIAEAAWDPSGYEGEWSTYCGTHDDECDGNGEDCARHYETEHCYEGKGLPQCTPDEYRAHALETCADERTALMAEVLLWPMVMLKMGGCLETVTMEQSDNLLKAAAPLCAAIQTELRESLEFEWVSFQIEDAATYGAASHRVRTWMVACRDGAPDGAEAVEGDALSQYERHVWGKGNKRTPLPKTRPEMNGRIDFLGGRAPLPSLTVAQALGWESGLWVDTRGVRKADPKTGRIKGGGSFSADTVAQCVTATWYGATVRRADQPQGSTTIAGGFRAFTQAELGVLVGFRWDYPWQHVGRGEGIRNKAQQAADAVSPFMGMAVTGAITPKARRIWYRRALAYQRALYAYAVNLWTAEQRAAVESVVTIEATAATVHTITRITLPDLPQIEAFAAPRRLAIEGRPPRVALPAAPAPTGRAWWEPSERVTLNGRAGRTAHSHIGRGVYVRWDDGGATYEEPRTLWAEGTEPEPRRVIVTPYAPPRRVIAPPYTPPAPVVVADPVSAPMPEPLPPVAVGPDPTMDLLAMLDADLDAARSRWDTVGG